MPTSFRGYNYLLVMQCNHSRFIITDTLKSRKASKVAILPDMVTSGVSC